MKICFGKIHLAEDNKELDPLMTLPEWLVLVCLAPGGSCPVSVSNIYTESQQIIAGTIQSFVGGCWLDILDNMTISGISLS